MQVILDS